MKGDSMTSNLAAANSAAEKKTTTAHKRSAIALLTAALLTISLVLGAVFVHAGASAGIMNNGTDGVYIDIYGPYYKELAKETSNEYSRGGCAWYASSRASELVGKNLGVHGPANWWDSIAAEKGFRKTSDPVSKGFAIYSNHMVVIENVSGDTATISEGSNPGASDAAHGYCAIRRVNVSSLKSLYKGQSFRGFIDLGVRTDNPPQPDSMPENPGAVYVAKGTRDNTWHSYRGDAPDFTYTGVAKGKWGWWRILNGNVEWDATGVYKNEYGWWKVTDGKVDFTFTGIDSNVYGSWYIVNGKADFTFSGDILYKGRLYTVTEGRAVLKS